MDSFLRNGGRYIYAIPFAVFGLFHFMNANAMAGMVPIPGGVFWVYLTGLAFLAACVSFIIEKKVRLAGTLLGILLLIFVLTIHVPGIIGAETDQQSQMSMTNLLKDLVISGGAFYIAGTYTENDIAKIP